MELRRLALRARSPFPEGSWRRGTLALAFLLPGVALENGCGTGAVDVDGCRQIEEARCRQAPGCGIPITPPYFTSGTNVEACIRFYDDACLHGLASSDPGAAAVNACVMAIQNDTVKKDGCSIVLVPQTDQAACGWLVPPASTPADAAAEAASTEIDAAADASSQ